VPKRKLRELTKTVNESERSTDSKKHQDSFIEYWCFFYGNDMSHPLAKVSTSIV
jgi:hypothetical protein